MGTLVAPGSGEGASILAWVSKQQLLSQSDLLTGSEIHAENAFPKLMR
jgi:hypothetical protein